jgi:prepilin signal peptidase PulO-like enzyme (type II secretory pathway)
VNVLLFFLLGLALAFACDRLILRFQRIYEHAEDEDAECDASELSVAAVLDDGEEAPPASPRIEVKQLPWQVEPWSSYLRRGVVLFLPPLTAVAGWRFERPIDALAVSLLVAGLLVCTATDLLRYRVPNAVTYPGTGLALLAALFLAPSSTDLLSAFVAAVLAGLIFLVMAVVTRGGLGLGDVKLSVLIGAALGLQATYQALALGVLAGGVIMLALWAMRFIGRKQAIPYAPFLAVAAVLVLLTQGPVFAPL